jgi:toxin YoeB
MRHRTSSHRTPAHSQIQCPQLGVGAIYREVEVLGKHLQTNLFFQLPDYRIDGCFGFLKRVNHPALNRGMIHFHPALKPEPLKHALAGYWSRRINDEHRIVYRTDEDAILIAQLRYHY